MAPCWQHPREKSLKTFSCSGISTSQCEEEEAGQTGTNKFLHFAFNSWYDFASFINYLYEKVENIIDLNV